MIVYDPDCREPHWAPGAADYLANQIRKDDHCFEWGGGMSTPWLCSLVSDGKVLTVEDDPFWIKRIREMTEGLDNFRMIHQITRDAQLYVDVVGGCPQADVYLIDGYRRIECFEKLKTIWKPGNVILLDDALDYVGGWCPEGVKVFSMPHPYAGKKVTRNLWGNTHLKVGDLHHETKETWVWRVV